MADVFILEGEEMNQEWLHIAQRHKEGRRTSVLEDDGGVCLSAGGLDGTIAESGRAIVHLCSL